MGIHFLVFPPAANGITNAANDMHRISNDLRKFAGLLVQSS
jgi:hypothetical protein